MHYLRKKGLFMSKSVLGHITIILAAVIWGCVGLFTRNMSAIGFTSLQITFVRALFTALLMFIYLFIFKRHLLKIRLRDIPIFLGSGIASFLFFNVCYMSSIQENSLSVACMLMYSSPIWVTIISAFVFKDKVKLQKIIALIVALGGCVLVTFQGAVAVTPLGLVYGILSGVGYALYSIFGSLGVMRFPAITATFYTFVFATLGGLPLVLFTSDLPAVLFNTRGLTLAVAAAVCTTLVPYFLYTFGLKYVNPSTASIISIIEPIMATIVGLVAFGEALTVQGVLGIVVVIGALLLLEIPLKKRKKKENKNEV